MSTSWTQDRLNMSSKDTSPYKRQTSPNPTRQTTFNNTFAGETFAHYQNLFPQHLSQSLPERYEREVHRNLTSHQPMDPQKPPDSHRERVIQGNIMSGRPHDFSKDRLMAPNAEGSKRRRMEVPSQSSGQQLKFTQPLHIETDHNKIKMEPLGGYHPETEAISPTLPTESHDSKSDIVNSISQVDREINSIENQLQQLMKKQSRLEAEAAKPREEIVEEDVTGESKPLSIAQIIYKENRKLAQQSHQTLMLLGPSLDIPMYHEPCDTPVYHENMAKFEQFKMVLQSYFKKKAIERTQEDNYLAGTYEKMVNSWLKKVEAKTLKKNIKDQKTRELYEKIFPEIKKQREDKDRIQNRVGSRGGVSGYARTEAELEQIVDGIQEQEEEEKKMRAYAVIPPLRPVHKRHKFIDENGLIREPMAEYKERKQTIFWGKQEKDVFKERYLDRPKQFGLISEQLPKKALNDCVLYYYMSKKTENYKQLLKKQVKRPPRKQQFKPTSIRGSNEDSQSATQPPVGLVDVGSDDDDTVTRSALEDARPHKCASCNETVEHLQMSHPVSKSSCAQFGLAEKDYQEDWRVCTACKCKSVRRTACPIPGCKTPKKKVRHLRPLPVKWTEISSSLKDSIMKGLELKEEVNRCCSNCYDLIVQLLDQNPSVSNDDVRFKWTDDEINAIRSALGSYGKKWAAISTMVKTKTEEQCRKFYASHKRKHGLHMAFLAYRKCKMEEGRELGPSDEDSENDHEDNDDSSDGNSSQARPPSAAQPVSSAQNLTAWPYSSSANSKQVSNGNGDRKQSSGSDRPEAMDVMPSQPLNHHPKLKPSTASVGNAASLMSPFSLPHLSLSIPTFSGGGGEKVDYDSSATASADEGPTNEVSGPAGDLGSRAARPLTSAASATPVKREPVDLAVSIIKCDPGLMHNPDGMIPTYSPDMPAAYKFAHQRPSSGPCDSVSTSVRDLIDSAIEDALTNTPDLNGEGPRVSGTNVRPAALSESIASLTASRTLSSQTRDLLTEADRHGARYTPPHPRSKSDNNDPQDLSRRKVPLPQYKGDPRDFSTDRDLVARHHGMHGLPLRGSDSPMIRPPPAHSHHLTPSQLEHRKSPAVGAFPESPYSPYSGEKSSTNRSPPGIGRPPGIGHPPPLISSGMPMAQTPGQSKKDSHAGGSILQGTSASHSHQSRFESGSISHGTPRSHAESSPRGDEKSSRSPRSQPQPSPGQRNQQQQHQQQRQELERKWQYHQYQTMMTQMMQRAVPPFQSTYPGVLNDYLIAQQLPGGKDDKLTAAAKEQQQQLLLASLQAGGMVDPQTLQLMMAMQAANNPRLMAPGRMLLPDHRLLTPVSQSSRASPRDDSQQRHFTQHSLMGRQPPESSLPSSQAGSQHRIDSEPVVVRQQRPSIMQGLGIPKNKHTESAHNLSRLSDRERQSSSSPSHRQVQEMERRTQYEKEMDEMQRRRLMTDRTRTDSERTLTDTETSHTPGRHGEYYHHRSGSISNRSDLHALSRSSEPTSYGSSRSIPGTINAERAEEQRPGGSWDKVTEMRRMAEDGKGRPENNLRDERRMILEADRAVLLAKESESRAVGEERKRRHEEMYSSKRLAEMSKEMQDEHIHKDASTLFSASFEKDQHLEKSIMIKDNPDNQTATLTAASIINAIITKQINSDSVNEGRSSSANPHTSVIVPPKKPRMMQHSRSDSDIPAHHMESRLSDSNSPQSSVLSGKSGTMENRQITLADHINEIINNDYNKSDSKPPAGQPREDKPKMTSGPYRVEDIEPISPPNSTTARQSPKSSGTSGSAEHPKRHSGIRSLLSADSMPGSHGSGDKSYNSMPVKITPFNLSPMDYVKNKIEEAIRTGGYDNAASQPHTNHPGPMGAHGSNTPAYDLTTEEERLKDGSQKLAARLAQPLTDHRHASVHGSRAEQKPGQPGIEAMLAPPVKRPSMSPISQARSPEEVDVYSNMKTSSASTNHAPAYRMSHDSQDGDLVIDESSNSNTTALEGPLRLSNSNKQPEVNHSMRQSPSHAHTSPTLSRQSPVLHPRKSPGLNNHTPGLNSRPHSKSPGHMDSNRVQSPLSARESPQNITPFRQSPLLSNDRSNHSHAPLENHETPCVQNEHHRDSPGFALLKKSSIDIQPRPLLSERYETLSDDET